ncbi:MAG: hypothetical protein ABIJ46_03325 [bacterium]
MSERENHPSEFEENERRPDGGRPDSEARPEDTFESAEGSPTAFAERLGEFSAEQLRSAAERLLGPAALAFAEDDGTALRELPDFRRSLLEPGDALVDPESLRRAREAAARAELDGAASDTDR